MIIECDSCSTRFRLDDSRVADHGVKVRCTRCQNVFIVPTPEAAEILPTAEILPEPDLNATPDSFASSAAAPASPKEEPEAPSTPETGEETPEETKDNEEEYAPQLSFGDIDLTFIKEAGILDDVEGAERAEPAERAEEEASTEEIEFDLDALDKTHAPVGAEPDGRTERAEPTEPDEEEDAGYTAGTGEDTQPHTARSSSLGLVIALLIFIGGGAVLYFSGVIDTLYGALAPATVEKTVEIESIRASFRKNKRFGRLFVIEASLRNITDEPQKISGVRGVIYNDAGEYLAERMVSAGRVVSAEDIRNLPEKDLLKPFQDTSEGTLPPRGSIPVMVLFTELDQSLAEYGIDVIR